MISKLTIGLSALSVTNVLPGLTRWFYLWEVEGSDDPAQSIAVHLQEAHQEH